MLQSQHSFAPPFNVTVIRQHSNDPFDRLSCTPGSVGIEFPVDLIDRILIALSPHVAGVLLKTIMECLSIQFKIIIGRLSLELLWFISLDYIRGFNE